MPDHNPNPLRCLTLLNGIYDSRGPQEFGRVMQTLLAITFLNLGFKVIKNMIGVPDLIVIGPKDEQGYAMEVKTSSEKISLNHREMDAIKSTKYIPVLAFLDFPSTNPQWYLLDARHIQKGYYERHILIRKPRAMDDIAINDTFRRVLSENHWNIIHKPGYLNILFNQMGGKQDT